MSSAGQIPMGLQLAVSEPLGVRAYRRRFQSPMTSASAGPDDHINIYPDTSTPGAFIDHESTYLSFDFQIKNSEFCVDYTDFGVEGAAGALIQDWRVYNQGTILEEILDYPTVASALANVEGAYELETTMYFSSKLKGGFQDDCHRNFIKPPMVSGSGNCMFGPNPFGLGISALAMGETPVYSNIAFAGGAGSGMACNQLVSNPGQNILFQNAAFSNEVLDVTIMNSSFATNQAKGGSLFPMHIESTAVGPRPNIGNDEWAGNVTAALFPDLFSPSMVDIVQNKYVQEFGTVNKVQVMTNLCNVKCFPIGMVSGSKSCLSSVQAFSGVNVGDGTVLTPLSEAVAPIASNPTYRICYRPISGIFGKLATKMLATTLLAPQQMYISIHLAQAATVFNVTADPCRRIAGTIRDFVRNMGTRNGATYGSQTFTLIPGTFNPYAPAASSYAAGYTLYSSNLLNLNGLGAIFNANSCAGRSLVVSRVQNEDVQGRQVESGNNVQTLDLVVGGAASGGIQSTIPTPQYVLTKTPWRYNCIKGDTPPAITYCNENEVFYGTYLRASEPQSRRVFEKTITGATNNAVPNITYTITNLNLVGDQLILPNETTSDVILSSEAGNNNVSTNSIRTYPIQVPTDATQSITLPVKVNMAKRLFIIFQDMEARNATTGFQHDSNCGLNPFASLEAKGGPITKAGYSGNVAISALGGVGVKEGIEHKFSKAGVNQGISLQLRIGNDFYPPQPLTTMQEIATELVKTLEGWQDPGFSPDIDSRVMQLGTSVANSLVFDCLQPSKFCTAFVPIALLDDQTITGNPDFAPLHSIHNGNSYGQAAGSNYSPLDKSASSNGYNMICPRGYCTQGLFKSPSSRFLLGFNLRSFKDIDGVEGGTYLGNNTITLLMSGCHGLAVPGRSYRGLAIVPHRAMMRYSPGGQIVWAY